MSAGAKAIILAQVEKQSRGKRQALMVPGIPKSSYYRWRRGQPDSENRKRPWNRITLEEEAKVLALARESPKPLVVGSSHSAAIFNFFLKAVFPIRSSLLRLTFFMLE